MATNASLADTILANALARLAELDAVSIDTRARMTYSDGVRSYSWNEYRAAQQAIVDAYAGQGLLQKVQGPFTVTSSVRG